MSRIEEIELISPLESGEKAPAEFQDVSHVNCEVETYLQNLYGKKVYDFLQRNINLQNSAILILESGSAINRIFKPDVNCESILILKRINDIRYINKFFESVNSMLPIGGAYAGCVETKNLRKRRILNKYPQGMNLFVYFIDYVLKRIIPKLWLTKKIYFFITRGKNRVVTRAETFGRLISCGFRIKEQHVVDGILYFIAVKEKDPIFPKSATYGPLIRLSRVGKGGKIIKVYKFRTMHPYSEFLQDYVYQQNNLELNGKFKNDFRISTLGRIMRKLWLDELPMIFNLLRGDLKIVGVRPISKHYFNLYSLELKQKRILFKPGLIPPFYADLPQTLDEIMASEMRYLEAYEKQPFLTDLRYFFMAFKNIIFKKARSS